MQKLIINKDDAQKVLDFLAAKPYKEVFQIVPLLMGLPLLKEEEPAEKQPPAAE